MSFSLLPKMILNSLTDVTPELLKTRNLRLLMLDFDNTVVPLRSRYALYPTAETTG